MQLRKIILGAVAASTTRAAFIQALLWKFRRDVHRLNDGEIAPLLSAYAEDFILRFHPGDHRFAGTWHGRAGMAAFLENFTAAGIQGQIIDMAMSGPPWNQKLWVRFDDHADAPDGRRIHENRTVLLLRLRWGRIVEQQDFYADTAPIVNLERELRARAVPVIPRPSQSPGLG